MFVYPAATATFLLVNVVCACAALAVGFSAGVWFFGGRTSTPQRGRSDAPQDSEAQLAAERSVMASNRLKDLAKNIVSDIGAHSSQVEAITTGLRDVEAHPAGGEEAVISAIGQILAANSQLEKRLEVAEQQIQAQANEIKVHETEARTDSLTALANRRAFDDELQRRFAEWQRKQTPFTLLLMDIDHFKKFNDSHGHQAGDEVLRTVGRVLASVPRDMDLACRYGGEEFAVILPATTAHDAQVLAERLRTAVESTVTKFSGKSLKVTGSIGLAEISGGADLTRLVKLADDALYKSKQAGRNCGHLHDGQQCVPITPGLENRLPASAESAKAPNRNTLTSRVPGQGVFVDELRRRVAESHRFGIPLSVVYLTLDGYRSIQREYGASIAQLAVDAVVHSVAPTLREMDLLARWDDGHFVVLLPGSSDHEAALVAKRLQNVMHTCAIPLRDGQLRVKLLFGVAQVKPDDNVQTLMVRAQRAAEAATAQPVGV